MIFKNGQSNKKGALGVFCKAERQVITLHNTAVTCWVYTQSSHIVCAKFFVVYPSRVVRLPHILLFITELINLFNQIQLREHASCSYCGRSWRQQTNPSREKNFHWFENVIKQFVHTSAARSSRYEASFMLSKLPACFISQRTHADVWIFHFEVACLVAKPLNRSGQWWPCYDTNVASFQMYISLLSCELDTGLYYIKVTFSFSPNQKLGN